MEPMIGMNEFKDNWEIVIDFTQFYENGIRAAELLDRLQKI